MKEVSIGGNRFTNPSPMNKEGIKKYYVTYCGTENDVIRYMDANQDLHFIGVTTRFDLMKEPRGFLIFSYKIIPNE